MALGRPKLPLILTAEQREQLEAMAASRSLPHGLVSRVRIILLSATGISNGAMAAQLWLNQATVGTWRRRFLDRGISGLHEELRPGRPRSIRDERVAQLIRKTLRTKPRDGTHWSCRAMAADTRLSKSRCTASGLPLGCNRIGSATSSSPGTRSSWKRCATSSDSTHSRTTWHGGCASLPAVSANVTPSGVNQEYAIRDIRRRNRIEG